MLIETQICDEKGSASAELQEKVPGPGLFSSLLSQCNVLLCFDFGPLKGAGHQLALTNTAHSRAEPIVHPIFYLFFFFSLSCPFPEASEPVSAFPVGRERFVPFILAFPTRQGLGRGSQPHQFLRSRACGGRWRDGLGGGAKRRRLSLVSDIPLLQTPAVGWPWVPQHHVGCW